MNNHLVHRFAIVLVAALLAAGCNKSARVPAATPAPPIVDGTPATEEECKEFAGQIETAVRKRDRATLDLLLSIEELAIRCFSDFSLTQTERQSAINGIRKSTETNSVAKEIMGDVEKGGSYKLLRLHVVDGRARALFRVIGSAGVNYHDILVSRSPDGRLVMEDMYIFLTGEMLSQTMRRTVIPLLAETRRGILAGLRDSEKTYVANLPKIRALMAALRAKDGRQVVTIYKNLPREIRDQKVFLLMYIQGASLADDDEYTTAITAYRKLFPTDAAVDFLSIDYFLLKKEYDESLRCVEKVDQSVGGDPYLHSLRANVLIQATRLKEARGEADKAIELEPTLTDSYWTRITVALKEKNHIDTLRWLKKLVEATDEKITDLTTLDDYADFVKSPQHEEWRKWYESRTKE